MAELCPLLHVGIVLLLSSVQFASPANRNGDLLNCKYFISCFSVTAKVAKRLFRIDAKLFMSAAKDSLFCDEMSIGLRNSSFYFFAKNHRIIVRTDNFVSVVWTLLEGFPLCLCFFVRRG